MKKEEKGKRKLTPGGFEHENIIFKYDAVSKESKIRLALDFDSFMYRMVPLIEETFGGKISDDVYDMLLGKLDEYLKSNLEQNVSMEELTANFEPMLRATTKEYLLEKMVKNEIRWSSDASDLSRLCSTIFDEIEQKIVMVPIIYSISGYDIEDFSDVSLSDAIAEDTCKNLNISKLKYFKKSILLNARYARYVKKMAQASDVEPSEEGNKKISL